MWAPGCCPTEDARPLRLSPEAVRGAPAAGRGAPSLGLMRWPPRLGSPAPAGRGQDTQARAPGRALLPFSRDGERKRGRPGAEHACPLDPGPSAKFLQNLRLGPAGAGDCGAGAPVASECQLGLTTLPALLRLFFQELCLAGEGAAGVTAGNAGAGWGRRGARLQTAPGQATLEKSPGGPVRTERQAPKSHAFLQKSTPLFPGVHISLHRNFHGTK